MLSEKESEALNFLYLGGNVDIAWLEGGLFVSDVSKFKEEMQKLETLEYIEKKEDEKYKRGKYYKLTDIGIAQAKEILINLLNKSVNELKDFLATVPNTKDKHILEFLMHYFGESRSYPTKYIFLYDYPYALINAVPDEQKKELLEWKNAILDKLCSLGFCVKVWYVTVKGERKTQYYSTTDKVIEVIRDVIIPSLKRARETALASPPEKDKEPIKNAPKEESVLSDIDALLDRLIPIKWVTAGQFEHNGNGKFYLKRDPSVEIDVKCPAKIVEQILKKYGYSTENIGSFYYSLRKRAGLI